NSVGRTDWKVCVSSLLCSLEDILRLCHCWEWQRAGRLSICAIFWRNAFSIHPLMPADKLVFPFSVERAMAVLGKAQSPKSSALIRALARRSEEHTSELQSPYDLVCRLLLEKKKKNSNI